MSTEHRSAPSDLPRVGVSSCLLGTEVRFDGGHKRDRFLTDTLADFVEWVPVCPEVESGMRTPRPAMRLVQIDGDTRLLETKSGDDHTTQMNRYAKKRVRALQKLDLCGYVLKKGSPSCGMERVRIYVDDAMPRRDGTGMFAAELMSALPSLPIEEEGRLKDAPLRENFVERLFAYQRLRGLFQSRWTRDQVVKFHTAHKLQLMAHSPQAYREIGRLVADIRGFDRAAFKETYEVSFMDALRRKATPGRNTNVLQHAAGYLKQCLSDDSRAELTQQIEDYRLGLVPLVVPITLIAHHVRHHSIGYLQGQVYLQPHPKELMLRNHV